MTDISMGPAWPSVAGRWLLVSAVAGAALAVGTVHTVTLCVVTVGLTAACALTWWGAEPRRFRPRPASTLLLVTGVGLTAYTALQCVPLPFGWLARLAPHNADVWSRALSPLREAGPTWAPISLDPTATRIEVLKGVAYLLAFVTSLRIAQRREGSAFLSVALIATGTVLAATSLLHPAFGAHKLYGVFEPSPVVLAHDKHVAPFLNPNNLAAYLNVAFCLALAAAFAPEPPIPRPILVALTLALGTTQLWVASRGGVATMIVGAGLVFVIRRVARLRERRTAITTSLLVVLALTAGGMMIVFASSGVSDELFETSTTKLVLLRDAMRMVPSYAILGAGRGAFESTFPEFREAVYFVTFTHPENVVAQWTIEWGLPLGLLGLSAVVVGLRPSAVLARSSTATGAWCALVSVGLQSLVDLGSEIPGLVVALAVCGAIVVGGTAGREPRTVFGRWGRAPRALAIVAGAAALAAVLAAASGIRGELEEDRRLAFESMGSAAGRSPDAGTDSMTRAAMLRHPAEPYLPFIRGLRAARDGQGSAVRWIEATLERARVYGPAHLVLARVLANRSRSQARLEYRFAVQQAPETLWLVMKEAPYLVGSYDDARELEPVVDQSTRKELGALVPELLLRLPATCARLDAELLVSAPFEPEPLLRAARDAVADVETGDGAPWCDGSAQTRCQRVALERSKRAEEVMPEECEPRALHARARMAGGDRPGALREMAEAADATKERVPCLKALWELSRKAGDEGRAAEAIEKIASASCADDDECAANLAWAAESERRAGNSVRALALYSRASARQPEDDALLESKARLAASLGLHVQAADDYLRLARKHPDNAAWPTAAEEQRSEAARGAVNPN